MKRYGVLLFVATHGLAIGLGFIAGVYLLPILTAPPPPSPAAVQAVLDDAVFRTEFRRDLEDSDALHWGEGTVVISQKKIALMGKLAPGPDYRLYLSPDFVETEAAFRRLRPKMVQVGHVRTFDNFAVDIPPGIDPANYNSVIIWCEAFGQFITSARYR